MNADIIFVNTTSTTILTMCTPCATRDCTCKVLCVCDESLDERKAYKKPVEVHALLKGDSVPNKVHFIRHNRVVSALKNSLLA
jgi:hypothetical protein